MVTFVDGHRRIPSRLIPHTRNNTRCIQRSYFKRVGNPEMICDIICVDGECTVYECVDGVCCTPGSPESLCCPIDHPVCTALGCCATEYPIPCPPFCCEADQLCCVNSCCDVGELCCGLAGCCDVGSSCCNGSCCDAGKKCCAGRACCEANETCCGDKCCRGSQKCVLDSNGQSTCTDELISECDKTDFSHKCPSQFDAIHCFSNNVLTDIGFKLLNSQIKCPDFTGIKHLYRVLRSDESCVNGLKPKDPIAQKSPLSFVNCGSMPDYSSQFVSFTSSLGIAELYANHTKSKVIAKIDLDSHILNLCKIFDCSNPKTLTYHIGNAESGIFAMKSCVYLLLCSQTIPCDIINNKFST